MQHQTEHRKQRIAINEPGHAHFLTYSCWQRKPLLSKHRACAWVIEAIEKMRSNQDVAIWAYVIMPEHVHLLIRPNTRDYEMRQILGALKAPVSRAAKAFLEASNNNTWLNKLTAKHGKREVFRFWQPGGGYDENIWKTRTIETIIDYIHANPVRRGLVERPTDWMWSSARTFAGLQDGPLVTDQVDCP